MPDRAQGPRAIRQRNRIRYWIGRCWFFGQHLPQPACLFLPSPGEETESNQHRDEVVDPTSGDRTDSSSLDEVNVLGFFIPFALVGLLPGIALTATGTASLAPLQVFDPGSWIVAVLDAIAKALTDVLGSIFVGMIESFLVIDPPYPRPGPNAMFMQNLQYALLLLPIVVVIGAASRPVSESSKAAYPRQLWRFIMVFLFLALARPVLHVAVVMTNATTVLVMPETYAVSLAGPVLNDALADIVGTAFAAILLYIIIGTLSFLALALVVIVLFLRVFLVELVYIGFPLLLVAWYIDWGPFRYANHVAGFVFRITAYLLIAGPLIALALQTGCTISAPDLCVQTATGGGGAGAEALTAGYDPSEEKLEFWKRFLGWLTGLGLAGFVGIQSLSMGGSSGGHLLGLGAMGSLRGGQGMSTGAAGGSSGGSGPGGNGPGPSDSGGPPPAGQIRHPSDMTEESGPTLLGTGFEFHPRTHLRNVGQRVKQQATTGGQRAKQHASWGGKGIKSRAKWARANPQAGTRAGAEGVLGATMVGAREVHAGLKYGASHANDPIVGWPAAAARRYKHGQINVPSGGSTGTTGIAGSESEAWIDNPLPEKASSPQLDTPVGGTRPSPGGVPETHVSRTENLPPEGAGPVEEVRWLMTQRDGPTAAAYAHQDEYTLKEFLGRGDQ